MITEAQRNEILAMVSPEAVRTRLLKRRELLVALLAGDDLLLQGVRPGGPEEMLSIIGLRAPLPLLTSDEVARWRQADTRYEDLYQSYLLRVESDDHNMQWSVERKGYQLTQLST